MPTSRDLYGSRYPIERDKLIRTYDGRSGWYANEGTHRWTNGDAWFPLPSLVDWIVGLAFQTIHINSRCSERNRKGEDFGRDKIFEVAVMDVLKSLGWNITEREP